MQRIKKGDTVEIIAGKDIGERGEVLVVDNKSNRVIVNGLNMVKRHERARQVGTQQIPARIEDKEAPLHLPNVMLVCPSCNEKTRVGYRTRDDGYKVRVCKKCDYEIE